MSGASKGAVPAAPLQFIGLSPPLQASNNCRVPGDALARVNVPNRHLGYKACKYETEIVPALELRREQRKTREACRKYS